MTRPSLAEHDKRLALLEERVTTTREHDAAHDKAVLDALKEIRDDVKSLRQYVEDEVKAMTERQTKTETRVDTLMAEIKGTGRGIKIGWAAAFTLIGGGIAAVVGQITGWLK